MDIVLTTLGGDSLASGVIGQSDQVQVHCCMDDHHIVGKGRLIFYRGA